jgi:hypothetical protein
MVTLLLIGATACAPKLVVRHEDPTVSSVEIRVDGERRGFVSPGDVLRLRLARGWHTVNAVPEGGATNVWSADGAPWSLYLDKRADLTLLAQ